MRSYDKVFDNLFKDKITELCLSSQSCNRLTIGLTNMYHKWAIKLFGNYKKSMMIRKVYWICYKSDEKLS